MADIKQPYAFWNVVAHGVDVIDVAALRVW